MTESARWQIEIAQKAEIAYEEALSRVANMSDLSKKEMKALFEESAIESIKFDDSIYKSAGLNPIPLKQDKNMLSILLAGLNKTNGLMDNLTLTTAQYASDTITNALNDTYLMVISGAFDYNTAIKKTIKNLSDNGIKYFDYKSGKRMHLDSAVRMNVITGVQQTMGRVSLTRAEEMGCDLVEVTAHGGARPEHAEWQGKVFSISGKHKKYKSLAKGTGYGAVDGLKGANCRHDFFPYFEDISRPAYSKKELADYNKKNVEYNGRMYTEYEATQKQRYMERAIRRNKRDIAALEGAIQGSADGNLKQDLSLDWNKQKDKLKEKQDVLQNFIKQTESRRDASREQAETWALADRSKNIKRINNKTDLKQYNKYKEVLGEKNLLTFDKFKEMKYNKDIEYTNLKKAYREEILYSKIVNESLELNIKGRVEKKIDKIDIDKYKFKTEHINNQRNHNVSKEEAQKYINESEVEYVRWNGKVKIYVSKYGCTLVNAEKKEISTAYKANEYDDKFKKIMEVIENDKMSNN